MTQREQRIDLHYLKEKVYKCRKQLIIFKCCKIQFNQMQFLRSWEIWKTFLRDSWNPWKALDLQTNIVLGSPNRCDAQLSVYSQHHIGLACKMYESFPFAVVVKSHFLHWWGFVWELSLKLICLLSLLLSFSVSAGFATSARDKRRAFILVRLDLGLMWKCSSLKCFGCF